ncbi:oxidoreductase family protein [Pyrus ussuriensis x Pyrus communis]|uniref:Oxidoreductase family protein n=1 Tax=Pyrus ussuriensis x Pyrus communis TaxID=2448454 RepID=A0A5N5F0C7_9ROSA|nr:oxidoreductase family protein [Pyrus ussuriensis x Pyrus communis]
MTTMEALVCRKLGDPTQPISDGGAEKAIVVEKNHPIPELGSPTSVRVRVKATSLNYANYLQILGKYQEKPPLPFIPGSDYSGTVDSVGPAVSKFKVGDPVCSFAALGSFAQFIVADQKELYCWFLVQLEELALRPYSLARLWEPLSRGAEKVEYLKHLGVDHVVDSSSENVIQSVKDFMKSRKLKGVDVLYDPVEGKLTKEAMKVLSWGANILVIGFASGEVPVIPANIALVKNWTVHGLYCGSYKIHQPGVLEESLKELLSWVARGLISIRISHAYRLPEAYLAFSAIKDRKVIGKVMFVLDDERSARRLAKGSFRSAVELFRRLREDGLCPDNFTNPFVFKAIGRGSGRSNGSWVCAFVVKTVIYGLARNGKTSKGIELFTKMVQIGMKPDDFTFIVVLNDCIHGGLVNEGCEFLFFNSERKVYGIERGSNTMVA